MEDSIVVIQCAASKRAGAGCLQSGDGRRVMFVAQPGLAPANADCVYARPDDRADGGPSWREKLLRYNLEQATENPLGLLPAWQLYGNRTYKRLYDEWGPDNLYILSAGWGLIRADFLTPYYDITFSNAKNVDKYKRRDKRDAYDDLRMLPEDTDKPVVFFGGKDYVSLFCELTRRVKGTRHIFYNAINPPSVTGCELHKFDTRTKTNWHYEAARAFANGRMEQRPPW